MVVPLKETDKTFKAKSLQKQAKALLKLIELGEAESMGRFKP
ncbi:MAG: hypothetical protein R2865_15375 [Deinococcales bacterium]